MEHDPLCRYKWMPKHQCAECTMLERTRRDQQRKMLRDVGPDSPGYIEGYRRGRFDAAEAAVLFLQENEIYDLNDLHRAMRGAS